MDKMDKETIYAIKSIFLGASIHDAAVFCYRNDRAMREKFLLYCKHKNVNKYEEIAIEAANNGYTTPPVHYFRYHVLEFFSRTEIATDFLHGWGNNDNVEDVMASLQKKREEANRMYCIARARHQSIQTALNLMRQN
ncbi:hypothetical protein PXH59_00015 (plasmid) [Xenorhabdus sp. SF857]|uniref:hypothetical protein n=1 Tax=Xenorhabdus bakwenae TaxID=3026967 RepID=UPI00255802DD|nr:hypothetical protein [Xenorhabdus sp. SF857]WFQ78066.1 hypothetical protein PXH59_00005 [Xenorhabdus sp. SF857]WFQ78068.1 hypothetical protein PXH59_00015 [Xenorhabdus sp. SF857]